jgi:hypothetical protein
MKFPLIVLSMCLATLAQSKESSAVPAGIPAGAVSIEGYTWRWVDKAGKVWIYHSTPFGIMRNEEPKQSGAKRPAGVPVDAVAMPNGGWRWVDPQQKVWLYRETPSGVMKAEESKGNVPSAGLLGQKIPDNGTDPVLDLISVKEEGDSLHFSRPGPFGKYSWVKKKTQLDSDETIVWQRAQAKSGSVKKQ